MVEPIDFIELANDNELVAVGADRAPISRFTTDSIFPT